jgi:TIR domain-containing protein
MGGIFISYRRLESTGYAGRISSSLASYFGANNIFMDVTGIGAGRRFKEVIDEALNACDAFLAIIGPQWATITNENGTPRLHDPDDHVRREVAAALARPDVKVIPVLVGDARMPAREQLPPDLAELRAWQAVELSERHWLEDLDQLVTDLGGEVKQPVPADPTPTPAAQAVPLIAVALGLVIAAGPAYAAYKAGLTVKKRTDATTVAHFAAGWTGFWAVVSCVVAAVIAAMGRDRRQVVPQAVRGLLLGALAGALGGTVNGVLRVHGGNVKPGIVLGFAVTGAVFGLSRIAGRSLTIGLVGGAGAGALGGVIVAGNMNGFMSQALPAVLILIGIAALQTISAPAAQPAPALSPVQRLQRH